MQSSVLLGLDPFLYSSACQAWNGTCYRIEENAQVLWALYVTQHSVIYSPPHNWVAYRRGSHSHSLMPFSDFELPRHPEVLRKSQK